MRERSWNISRKAFACSKDASAAATEVANNGTQPMPSSKRRRMRTEREVKETFMAHDPAASVRGNRHTQVTGCRLWRSTCESVLRRKRQITKGRAESRDKIVRRRERALGVSSAVL